jgi:hypothetical protein
MKLITGWVMSAGLMLAATVANGQVLAPHDVAGSRSTVVSDVGGPYAAMPQEALAGYGRGPILLPPQEVYTVLRESGFSPLGIPQLRGQIYTIAVIDRGGDDGRLVIDARTGRIIRFLPAYRMGGNLNDDPTVIYGPAGPLPPVSHVRGPPRPPLSIPRVASRTPLPVPRASPSPAGEPAPLAAKPAAEPAQRSAAAPPAKPVDAQAAAPAVPAAVEAKPASPQVQLQPTQPMPKAQGLD